MKYLLWIAVSGFALTQVPLEQAEIDDIFLGINIDASSAIEKVEAKGITPYDFGFRLLDAGEVEKSIKWFQSLAIATNDLQYVYGLARVKWKTGDSIGAMKDCQFILAKDPAKLLRARTYFLLGSFHLEARQFEDSEKYLRTSLDLYQELNKDGGQFLCLMELGHLMVRKKMFDEGMALLHQALDANERVGQKGKKPYSLGRYYEILSVIHFFQSDFEKALVAVEDAMAAYIEVGKTDLFDELLAKKALLKLLTGNPSEASDLAAHLWHEFHDDPNRGRLMAYNNVTLMKLALCSQDPEDAEQRKSTALAWASFAQDGEALRELLQFVENEISCPEWR